MQVSALTTRGADHAAASIASVARLFDPGEPVCDSVNALGQFLGGMVDAAHDIGDLIRCEVSADATGGTLELVSLQVLPSQALLELLTAVAIEREDVSIRFRHGWPILSVGCCSTTVTEEAVLGNRAASEDAHPEHMARAS